MHIQHSHTHAQRPGPACRSLRHTHQFVTRLSLVVEPGVTRLSLVVEPSVTRLSLVVEPSVTRLSLVVEPSVTRLSP